MRDAASLRHSVLRHAGWCPTQCPSGFGTLLQAVLAGAVLPVRRLARGTGGSRGADASKGGPRGEWRLGRDLCLLSVLYPPPPTASTLLSCPPLPAPPSPSAASPGYMLARIGLLQLSLPAVVGFAPNPSVSVDDLCEALATYANDGCGMDTTGKDKRACVVELSVFSGSDGALSTDEAAAAFDTIPDAVLTAIEAVDVGATCKREHLQRTGSSGSDLLDMFFYRANWRLVVKDCYRSGCGGRAWALWAGSPSLANLASAASAA